MSDRHSRSGPPSDKGDHPHGGPPGQTGQNPGQGGAAPPGQTKPEPTPVDGTEPVTAEPFFYQPPPHPEYAALTDELCLATQQAPVEPNEPPDAAKKA